MRFRGWLLVSVALHLGLGGVVAAAAGWKSSEATETVIDLTGSFRTRATGKPGRVPEEGRATTARTAPRPDAPIAGPVPGAAGGEIGEGGDPDAPLRDVTMLPELRNRGDLKRKLARYYPPEEKTRGVEGVVLMEVVISSRGRIASSRVIRSDPPGFAGAAALVCSELEFRPAYVGAKPVAVRIRIPIRFELER